jgi:hypothetical protein
VDEWAGSLAGTGFSRALRGSTWLYPFIETAHIFGFVVLVGSIVMFDVRLLGASRHLSVSALGAHLRKWSLASIAVVVPTGTLLFVSQPVELVSNPVFAMKLVAIGLAALNAIVFQIGVHRSVASWDTNLRVPRAARFHALASLTLWATTLTCGRLLAYT